MKIGLNATCLNDRPSGARQRFFGIYGELVKLLPETEFVVYEPADCRVAAWFGGAKNVVSRRTPIPSEGRVSKLFSGLGYWGRELTRERFDLFEGFSLPLVASESGRNLLTVHDFRGLSPETPYVEHLVYKHVLDRSVRSADRVITVSATMKAELLAVHPGIEVSVVHNGLEVSDRGALPKDQTLLFLSKYQLCDNFMLAVGHMEKRKNYPRLIDALRRLHDRGLKLHLLIIGNDSGERAFIERQVVAARLSEYVRILSGLSDLEVRCAYQLCRLFVFPSYYEGFGIPILEAMAANRPMVLSDIPVFREITEGEGRYFPTDDPGCMADAIESVLADDGEQARLVRYGQSRVNAFGYRQLASQMQSIYKALI